MATETATLIFRADTSELKKARERLKKLQDQTEKTEGNNRGLGTSFRRAAAGAAVFAGAIAAVSKTLSVARQFDVISASLKTMTGSTAAAEKAFSNIQEFAANTPYDLAQVATAFTKLKAMGLDPSMSALEAYGNTASAMGKSLNQMIEAVADAATGEFERLKEFGIRASKQGDEVSLTFKGITKTIGFSAAEIEKYLQDIGENEFGGAMSERAATLDGALSNLGDQWDMLFLTITKSGVGSIMQETARDLTDLIATVDRAIRSFSGGLTLDEQLVEAKGGLKDLRKQASDLGWDLENAYGGQELSNRIDEQKVLIMTLEAQIKHQKGLNEAEKESAKIAREAANEKAAEKKAGESRTEGRAKIEDKLNDLMMLGAAEIELIDQQEEQRKVLLDEWRAQGLIDEQEYQAALQQVRADAGEQRRQLLDESLQEDQFRIQSATDVANALLAAEDMILRGRSEKQKAGFRLAMGLMDAEKRENAKKIISSSYAAGMDAFKALAGIPIIGPALGAAAFAGIVALGVSSAATSLSGRALGGQVRGGESYIVGERGPEVLTMGGNGSITPNEALRGSGGQTVNKTANVSFNIQANDTTGFDELLNNRRGQIIGMINEALNDQGKAALV